MMFSKVKEATRKTRETISGEVFSRTSAFSSTSERKLLLVRRDYKIWSRMTTMKLIALQTSRQTSSLYSSLTFEKYEPFTSSSVG